MPFIKTHFLFKHRVVQVTSPRLNNLIVIGAILFYIDIYFFVMPLYNPVEARLVCVFTIWLTVTAYTLCFGPVMVKMFRVYLIFKHPKPGSRKVIYCVTVKHSYSCINVMCTGELVVAPSLCYSFPFSLNLLKLFIYLQIDCMYLVYVDTTTVNFEHNNYYLILFSPRYRNFTKFSFINPMKTYNIIASVVIDWALINISKLCFIKYCDMTWNDPMQFNHMLFIRKAKYSLIQFLNQFNNGSVVLLKD